MSKCLRKRPRLVKEAEDQASTSTERNEPCQEEMRESGTPALSDVELQSLLSEARAEVIALRSQIVSQTNSVHDTTSTVNWALFKDGRLIPEFDPSSQTHSIEEWLQKVNDCAAMYHWNDITKMYIALGKLQGRARIWYDGLKSTQFTWNQWEVMLKEMFPSKITFGRQFYEAATYHNSPNQDLNDYCFHKLTKLNKLQLNLSDAQIVDCVIEGIVDCRIRLAIKGARCTNFVELSEYVTNIPGSSTSNLVEMKSETNCRNVETRFNVMSCYNCKRRGHKRNDCPKLKSMFCNFCKKFGHTLENCRTKPREPRENKDKV